MPKFVESADTVLVIGATSGIGKAIAIRLHSQGKTVIATGRRQENLDALSKELNHERIFTVQWDITDLGGIPAMVDTLSKHYGPRMNAVIISSGIQRSTDFTKPEELDFVKIDAEITTNFTAYIRLIAAWLPYLTKLGPSKTPWLAVISSSLAIVPMARTPVYNGTKAALHQTVLSIRAQLSGNDSPVHLVEVYPPKVKTELHDLKHQPDLVAESKPAMEIDEFTDELFQGLEAGKLDIPCGRAKVEWEKVDVPRQELFTAVLEKPYGS